MSHFTVLVIGNNPENKLEPFDENLQVEPYNEKCHCIGLEAKKRSWKKAEDIVFDKFPILNDIFSRLIDEYETSKVKAELSSDDKEKMRFLFLNNKPDRLQALKEYCRSKDKEKENSGDNIWKLEYIDLADNILLLDPAKDFPDPICSDCNGTGISSTTYNPNSKWDWYEIGGRWHGNFFLKPNIKRENIGKPSWGLSAIEIAEVIALGKVDQALMSEIDWERTNSISDEQFSHLNALWDWIDGLATENDYEKRTGNHIFYKKQYYIELYGTREEHIRRAGLFTTYAVLTEDGKWHAPGDMGWFGMSSDSPEEKAKYEKGFFDMFLKDLSPNTMLTVVDCHI
jgi:hypothetical protein